MSDDGRVAIVAGAAGEVGRDRDVHPYTPGSWGPPEADALAGPDSWLLGP
jgi:hypothetical protein